jgi:PAS domain-containing protein
MPGQGRQHEIELILMRELASHLAMAIFVVGPQGDLLYYNERAEELLGSRFDETGEVAMAEWATAFSPRDEHGTLIPPERLPLVISVREGRPAHGAFSIRSLDGKVRDIELTAIPLVGQAGRLLGAAAVFWEEGTR